MPKVSQQHLDARRAQIVEAAARCFARQGFHATTVQDVLRESGLSTGAVYRYFRSKGDLVSAVAEQSVAAAVPRLAEVLLADPVPAPADAIAGVVAAIDPFAAEDAALRMAVQVWAEALRDDDLGALARSGYRRVRGLFVNYAERAVVAGLLPAGTDTVAAGQVYFGLVPGFILQRLLLADVDPASYANGLRAVLAGS
ncbi:TetR/AcrR family transcriptional regulator [Pseudonocardia sp. KRD-182]|uniref:TetR/AcrR family transcriptional regulator n=1 Tax=Pseudonocardia oceani TaxID=2792013 RepID=UPI001C49E42A|nr:TetR/AcrR family transcriptional regulator [Pseudonocardia oceani]MBW0107937.1 TetR/AcrR family transcriptional regulator [Pseudonocardia oceani]